MKTDLKLKEKNEKELADLLTEKRETLRGIRFGTAGHIRDTHSTRKTRADVARILTELNARKTA
jgi:ribosomal protein L29